MDTNTVLTFIKKTVKKTKSGELLWYTLPPSCHIKPLPEEVSGDTAFLTEGQTLSRENSYVAAYKTGELLLLVYTFEPSGFLHPSLANSVFTLRVQDSRSKFSVEITSSGYDPVDANELSRLYNLIDKDTSHVRTLVDDFLNS